METASVIALVGSAVKLGDAVLRTSIRLSSLISRYRKVDLFVTLLVGQLYTVRTALNQLSTLEQTSITSTASSNPEWLAGLTTARDGCSELITLLDEQLDRLEKSENGGLNVGSKILYLWKGAEMKEFLDRLFHQVNALNLLLNVIRWYGQIFSLSTQRI
jgi:hypothetical protein